MKKFIITEEEKKQILNLYQIDKQIIVENYTTKYDQKVYFGNNTSFDYIDIPAKTQFVKTTGGATTFGGKMVFSCGSVGTVTFDKGKGYKHFTYNKKTYWGKSDFVNVLKKQFCTASDVERDEEGNMASFVDQYKGNTGCVKGNCKNGYGEYIYKNGNIYKGNFVNYKENGYGVLMTPSFSNKNKYDIKKGTFKDGQIVGYSTDIDSEGYISTDNTKTGYETFKSPSGSTSTKNRKTGYTVEKWVDGSGFTGMTDSNNVKNGYGVYKNSKGISFKGTWKDNKLNGKTTDDLDKLTKPLASVSSNPQTPVSSKPSDAPDTKTFQQWVINKKGDKTILGKGGDSGFGDDGQWGARTKVAWDKYKNEYELETNAKFQGINPNEDGSGENFKPPVATNR
jgi:hypothetical protein